MPTDDTPDHVLTPDEEAAVKKFLTDFWDEGAKGSIRLTKRLFRHGPKIVTARRVRMKGFEERLYNRWGEALDFYELCLYAAQSCGEYFYKSFSQTPTHHKFEALTRLHAGASRVAGEILTLLSAGYASGAHARWRTLHEISVIALFISQEDDEVAERYHNHKFVKSYEDAIDHRKFASRLNQEPISDKEFGEIEADFKRMIDRYGASFRGPFGWARAAIEKRNSGFSGRIGIEHIQDAIQVEHWRPYYRMASHAVHPSATFLRFNLGTPSDSRILLAGPSNSGLSEPGQGALMSLGLATAAFLTYDNSNDDEDRSVFIRRASQRIGLIAMAIALNEIIQTACNIFVKIEKELDQEIIEETRARK